ncbi:hypothetical protein NCCP2716_26320 [Sporosarcina sp. NCCP-2716]|uniref:aspartyl-tRNA synthetase n=1 Tax=Sporosarcina sp. NCCP-2716 TaxID=2943679 RepID=UPI00203FFEB5|nr:aspartyl-tRNA synthetase [Sporosarcina sp. NCCP-2716]GKV70134.1 hypothetical protein NCCP2716_26320 [Sporosarcina sp. NCCP-2716]
MRNRSGLITVAVAIVLVLGGVWIVASDAYGEPEEALAAYDPSLLLIPAYQLDDRALYFFINDRNGFGATYVRKGLFGWKNEFLSWSSLDQKRKYDGFGSVQGHGGTLVYGLTRHGEEWRFEVDGEDAEILNLETLPAEQVQTYRLEGLSVWYAETEEQLDDPEIIYYEKETGEELEPE